ncbi:MAG TPA: hypothetical protein VFF74_01370 [Methylophilaceae bacterium]|nr:hypothetical protein [Methylophilaceae bacterium]
MEKIKFSDFDQKQIATSVSEIRRILRKHDADISAIVGYITSRGIKNTETAVSVRFEEESVLKVQMNMLAFD